MTRRIPLTKGYTALVDDEDYERFGELAWCALIADDGHVYARRTARIDGRRRTILLHRVILGDPPDHKVDHINGDTLDCRRSNLRRATSVENGRNRTRISRRNTSGYHGVTWHKRAGKWQAGIRIEGRFIYLGLFDDPEPAAAAYDEAAREHFGEFAPQLNFPVAIGAVA
jgi:hypothetical protein